MHTEMSDRVRWVVVSPVRSPVTVSTEPGPKGSAVGVLEIESVDYIYERGGRAAESVDTALADGCFGSLR